MNYYKIDVTKDGTNWQTIFNDELAAEPKITVINNDPFGIKKLYKSNGREVYMNMQAKTIAEIFPGRIDRMPTSTIKNADDSWKVSKNETPRWVIKALDGEPDWDDVEITMELRAISGGTYLQIYAHGEQHTTDPKGAWHGSANKGRLVLADGNCCFIKELYHESNNSGYSSMTPKKPTGMGALWSKWIRAKVVFYKVKVDNKLARKMEMYVDVNKNNNWVKTNEYLDNGNLPVGSGFDSFMAMMKSKYPSYIPKNRLTNIPVTKNEVINWGGRFVSFRSDNTEYDFRYISVRDIIPELL